MFTEHTNPNRFVDFHWCILCKHTFIDTLDWHGSWSISILVFAPTSKAFILALYLPFIGQRTLLLVSSGTFKDDNKNLSRHKERRFIETNLFFFLKNKTCLKNHITLFNLRLTNLKNNPGNSLRKCHRRFKSLG